MGRGSDRKRSARRGCALPPVRPARSRREQGPAYRRRAPPRSVKDGLVVERRVVAVLLDEQLDLLVRARAADHPAGALQLGGLADLGADDACSTRDEGGVALLDLREALQPDVGGEGREIRVHLPSACRVENRVVAPAEGVRTT